MLVRFLSALPNARLPLIRRSCGGSVAATRNSHAAPVLLFQQRAVHRQSAQSSCGGHPHRPNHEGRRSKGRHDSNTDAIPRREGFDGTVETPAKGVSPLRHIFAMHNRKSYAAIEAFADANWDMEKMSLLQFCGNPCDARDLVLVLMRVYVALGRMDKVRRVFTAALRDLQPQDRVANGRSLLNASVFNGYLEALTRRKNYDKDEVIFILDAMKENNVAADSLTYHYLIELHIRAGYDPQPLWHEAALLLRVVPYSNEPAFSAAVVKEALLCGASVMDKRTLGELIERWLRAGTGNAGSHRQPGRESTQKDAQSAVNGGATSPPVVAQQQYPPEYVMWLMLSLEVRCVLDKASFVQYVQKQHIAELLLRCAKSADATTAAEALALMDRHVMTKTADILSLVVWCWAQAGELERAFDMIELMARKGYLELTDPLKKYYVECLRYTMDRSFLMILADAVATPTQYERVLRHLKERRRKDLVVSVHALDVLVLAAGKLGEERRALQLAMSYSTQWGVHPRTATLNCLLVGCTAQQSSVLLDTIYEAMLRCGVRPNAMTFRILIRQSVLNDCIDDAVRYLSEVATHPGLRVEVEMILPIMERAARVGDVETVNRVSKFSLDCDIGVDGAVLQNIMKHLAEAGQSVEVLKGQQPLHEALRSRSKTGRQRVRSELVL